MDDIGHRRGSGDYDQKVPVTGLFMGALKSKKLGMVRKVSPFAHEKGILSPLNTNSVNEFQKRRHTTINSAVCNLN